MRFSTVFRTVTRTFTASFLVALCGRAVAAQGVCEPPKSSNEAKLLAFFATAPSKQLFSAAGVE